MEWFIVACAVAVGGLAALAGSGRFGSMPDPVRDWPVVELPAGDLTGTEVRGVQFAVAARGYSPAQVDAVLARLADQLDREQIVPSSETPRETTLEASAIMDPGEFSQRQERENHGSNEAPHG